MSIRKLTLAALTAVFVVAVVTSNASAAPSAPTPAWTVQALAAPTNFLPGDEVGPNVYESFFINNGGEVTDQSEITLTDVLPPGVAVKKIELRPPRRYQAMLDPAPCETKVAGAVSTVVCKVTNSLNPKFAPAKLLPNQELRLVVYVTVPPLAPGEVSRPLTNVVEVQGGGAISATAEAHNQISPEEDAPGGFQEVTSALTGSDGLPVDEADSHPYQYTSGFGINLNPSPPGTSFPFVPAGGDLKNIEVALPPGLVGNPMAAERCTMQQFNTTHSASFEGEEDVFPNECPDGSAVGVALVQQLEGTGGLTVPIYNLVPPKGKPALFGFRVLAPVYIDAKVRTGSDFGITGYLRNATQAKRFTASQVVFWGTPGDASHDPLRGRCAEVGGLCPLVGEPRPFFRLPSSCADPLLTVFDFESWASPPTNIATTTSAGAPIACEVPDFSPTMKAQPTTNVADSPAGLNFNLHIPQRDHEMNPNEPGEADLRDVTVTLPKGLLVNPASADGLASCSPAEIGLTTPIGQVPPHFTEAPPQCPNAAKVASVEADVPLLDHPLPGSVYLAKQSDNPFKSLIALYVVLDDPQSGLVIKLAGRVDPDPVSGQITSVFTQNPQAPVESFKLDFFGGARSSLRTPATCGTHTTTSTLVPWTAPAGPTVKSSDSFPISSGPSGPCPSGALDPKLAAGLANPTAGTYSTFSLRLSRADGTGEFAALTTTAPTGLVAKLAGIPYCPEQSIAAAASHANPGQGAAEISSPSCPAASQVGVTSAGAGAGPTPFYTGGKLYLAGPYKGAPLSLVAIIPAVAGPFDLGVVVNRIALYVDPETTLVTAKSDPLPTILAGIPLDVRDIRAVLDRPGFTLAPTNCEPKTVAATVLGTSGALANLSQRFQVGGCSALGFKPKLSLKLNGGTKRSSHPALKATVSYPKGAYANIARASVALPHSAFLEQSHIRTICTRVQFAANTCPKGSIYGKAKATSPLLDAPLAGPVYLRSSSHPLPDLVMALHGQIDVVVVGRIDSVNGGIRTTFDAVPDAPISKFTLNMQGGSKGLLVNSRNICAHTNRATVKMSAQNGKVFNSRPVLKDSCKKPSKGKTPSKR